MLVIQLELLALKYKNVALSANIALNRYGKRTFKMSDEHLKQSNGHLRND